MVGCHNIVCSVWRFSNHTHPPRKWRVRGGWWPVDRALLEARMPTYRSGVHRGTIQDPLISLDSESRRDRRSLAIKISFLLCCLGTTSRPYRRFARDEVWLPFFPLHLCATRTIRERLLVSAVDGFVRCRQATACFEEGRIGA